MADFSTVTPVPGLTTPYTSVLSIINDKFTDLVRGLDVSPTNLPTNSIAWSSANNKWRKWDGANWQNLTETYAINVATVTNGVYTAGDQTIAGKKSFSNPILLSNGSATAPALSFTGDGATDTGLFWSADGSINFTNNGTYSGSLGAGGNFLVIGDITAYGSTTQPSDARLKTNIFKIDNALSKVMQLNGITYNRVDNPLIRHTGVIAQDVQKVLPEAVVELTDTQKTLTVAYGNMVGLLVEAIKELKLELDALKQVNK